MEVIGSKWSYALKWCKPNNDNGDMCVYVLCGIGSMRFSSESVSSQETQGSGLQTKDMLDEDEPQQLTDVGLQEPADQPGVIGFTE